MIILLDIGNTSVTYGCYNDGRLLSFGSTEYNAIPNLIKKYTKSGRKSSINVVICSVVPKITLFIKKSFKANSRIKLWVVSENLPIQIKHKYKNISQLGNDRKLNIYGATRIYKLPLLIIDYGSAITLDYVSKDATFQGGMIIPGPEISFQALLQRAALIPKNVRLPHKTKSLLGKTTYDCMKSGILEGYGAMTDGLIQRFRSKFGKNLKVLTTGGFTKHLGPFTKSIQIFDPKLSVKSLLLLFKERERPLKNSR